MTHTHKVDLAFSTGTHQNIRETPSITCAPAEPSYPTPLWSADLLQRRAKPLVFSDDSHSCIKDKARALADHLFLLEQNFEQLGGEKKKYANLRLV